MFERSGMKSDGIDITLKNNPDHVLAPDDWDKVLDAKFGKISPEEYKNWYSNLMRERWKSRRKEIIDLARQGMNKDIKLKCFCLKNAKICHADLAASFLNNLIKKLQS